MSMYQIANDLLRLRLLPNPGASIAAFEARCGSSWLSLMRTTAADILNAPKSGQLASFTLAPWSNRIPDATFDFMGQRFTLRPNTPQGFAIHGDVRDRRWRVISQTYDTMVCALDSSDFNDFNFPFSHSLEIRYALLGNTFDTTLSIENTGESAMPVGFGFHPYFNRSLNNEVEGDASLQLNVAGVYPPLPGMTARIPEETHRSKLVDERSGMVAVPESMDFSVLAPVGHRNIDHCFGGWDGKASIVYSSPSIKLEFECDPIFGHVIVYTPPGQPFFAVEPVTHTNDGFNLFAHGIIGTGIHVLQPHDKLTGSFKIHVTGIHV